MVETHFSWLSCDLFIIVKIGFLKANCIESVMQLKLCCSDAAVTHL